MRYSPDSLFAKHGGKLPQFTVVVVDGQERMISDATADGVMLGGGTLVYWEQQRIDKLVRMGTGSKMLEKPISSPVVVVSGALGIDRHAATR